MSAKQAFEPVNASEISRPLEPVADREHMSGSVGLLGGSFNPAHGGHRRISMFASAALELDEVWWLVSPGNPLKPRSGMAPLRVRFASALDQARAAPIKVSAVEQSLGTRYTVDTLRRLTRRYPQTRFVWLMGSDNLAQFHRWKDWRRIARIVPIAVIARPGDEARLAPAMTWLGRYRVPPARFARTAPPVLTLLRTPPDPRSATAIREADPDWADRYATRAADGKVLRDQVTHRTICAAASIAP